MWMRCAQGMTWDAATQSCTGSAETFEYCLDFSTTCTGGDDNGVLSGTGESPLWDTCNDLSHAGYTDWRVPTIDDLRSIVYCSNGHQGNYCYGPNDAYDFQQPTLDLNVFGDPSSQFIWSSMNNSYFDDAIEVLDLNNGGRHFGDSCVLWRGPHLTKSSRLLRPLNSPAARFSLFSI